MQNWDLDTEIEDAMPPIVLFTSEWNAWLAETEVAMTDSELDDMEAREIK